MPSGVNINSELLPTSWVSKQKRKRRAAGATASSLEPGPCLLGHRPYQTTVFKRHDVGLMALLWRRQGGKTTTLAELAVKKMIKHPGRLVTFASVSLLCGREIIFKESQVFMRAFAALRQQAAKDNFQLELYDSKSERPLVAGLLAAPNEDREVLECGSAMPLSDGEQVNEKRQSTAALQDAGATKNEKRQNTAALQDAGATKASPLLSPRLAGINVDHFAELYEAQRLQFRLYHGNGVYSRTQVIAPNPATARGWTGDVLIDEIGFIKDLREVWEAMEPIVSSDPDFRVVMSTTPPEDDAHFAFELLAPERAEQFQVNLEGNWYRSAAGILVHRCDIFDAAAAGAPVYDLETREPLTPAEHFARALDKEAWRRNYGLQFLAGGASAVALAELAHAQQAGQGQALFVQVENLDDLEAALNFLRAHLTNGPVGVGWDLATTEKLTSNPSALAVVERVGAGFVARLILVWKTAEPQEAENRVRAVLQCIAERGQAVPGQGGPARRLCIDATNERYFASQVQKNMGGQVLVEPIVGSETVKVPGEKQPIAFKALLGHELLNALADGRLALPPERYIKEDFRLVKRNKGTFETELSPQGMHGDTFDACKLALRAVTVRPPGPIALVA